MKHLLTVVFLTAILAATGARAASPAPVITVSQCIDLRSAIIALDGHVALAANGSALMAPDARGVQRPVTVPYRFAPGVISKLADDEVLLDKLFADEQAEAQARKEKETAGGKLGGKTIDDDLNAETLVALTKPCPVADKLETVSDAELNIDTNNLPPSVVAGLRPILK